MPRNAFDAIMRARPSGYYVFVESNNWESETWRTFMQIKDKQAIDLINELIEISSKRSEEHFNALPFEVRRALRATPYGGKTTFALRKSGVTEDTVLDLVTNDPCEGRYPRYDYCRPLDSESVKSLKRFLDEVKASDSDTFLHKKGLFDHI